MGSGKQLINLLDRNWLGRNWLDNSVLQRVFAVRLWRCFMMSGRLLLIALLAGGVGCASLPDNQHAEHSYGLVAGPEAKLSQFVLDKIPADQRQSGVALLDDGTDAFVARMALASVAEKSIDAQYYIWHDDVTGNLLINELINAADRGVRVRLLVDDINLSSANDEGLAMIASHPLVSVRIFNPFSRRANKYSQMVTRFGDVTRRMHNKSFVVDGRISIIGGRNIGDEYFGANSQLEFADLDVLSIGPVVADVSSVYDLYWNSPLAYPIELLRPQSFEEETMLKKREALTTFVQQQKRSEFADKVRASELLSKMLESSFDFASGEVELLYDLPEKISSNRDRTELHLSNGLDRYIQAVKEEFLIVSPYFVPTDEGIDFLLGLEKRGVDVKIVTNSLASSDVSIVHAGYKLSRKKLLRGGVDLYEVKADLAPTVKLDKSSFGSSKASLHAKTFALDRASLFVGSLNFDPRSFNENTEIGMLIRSAELAQELGVWFDKELAPVAYTLRWDEQENGIQWLDITSDAVTTYDYDPGTSWWLRRWVDFLSLFPIESQL